MDKFTLVSKKKSRRRQSNDKKLYLHCDKDISEFNNGHSSNEKSSVSEIENKIYRSMKSIQTCRNDIQASQFWTDIKEHFTSNCDINASKTVPISRSFCEFVSYGIGNFATNPIARYQFAFLLLLAEFLEVEDRIYLYDPVLTDVERHIIEKFKIHLIPLNEECKRKMTARTLVFMLHCGKTMYDNLLSANWNPEIKNLVILGNAFSNYTERIPSTTLRKESPYISDILPYTREYTIKNSFEHKDIFNDTSFITFPSELLSTVDEDFWLKERAVSKTDDDAEILTKSKVTAFLT